MGAIERACLLPLGIHVRIAAAACFEGCKRVQRTLRVESIACPNGVGRRRIELDIDRHGGELLDRERGCCEGTSRLEGQGNGRIGARTGGRRRSHGCGSRVGDERQVRAERELLAERGLIDGLREVRPFGHGGRWG